MQGQGASASTPGVPRGARLRVALRALGGSRSTCSWHSTRTETSTSDATRRSRDTASKFWIGSWPHRRLRVCFGLRLRSLRGVAKNAAILRQRRSEPLTFTARSPQARVAGRPRRGSAWHAEGWKKHHGVRVFSATKDHAGTGQPPAPATTRAHGTTMRTNAGTVSSFHTCARPAARSPLSLDLGRFLYPVWIGPRKPFTVLFFAAL